MGKQMKSYALETSLIIGTVRGLTEVQIRIRAWENVPIAFYFLRIAREVF